MKKIDQNSSYHNRHHKRFKRTLDFIQELDLGDARILDLGPPNPLSAMLSDAGYKVDNTNVGQDLDLDFNIVTNPGYDVVTAFEIIEHMVSPFPLLRAIAANKLVISVPLSLWFAKAYWSETDPYDRHYHEFEPRQLKMLLEKAGWKVMRERKFTSYDIKPGIRPLLRMVTPRHYFVYCERTESSN